MATARQTRSFCYVSDLVAGIIKLMRAEVAPEAPVNIGNPGEFTMLELAQMVVEMTGTHSSVIRRPLPTDDPKQRRPVITRAKELLGWEPTISLREGLKSTIAYFEAELHRADALPRLDVAL